MIIKEMQELKGLEIPRAYIREGGSLCIYCGGCQNDGIFWVRDYYALEIREKDP